MSSPYQYPTKVHSQQTLAASTAESSDFYNQEYKASYDDLIDEYTSPYPTTSQHQTVKVDALPMQTGGHHRGPSQPLSSKIQFSTKQAEGVSGDHIHSAYPPKPGVREVGAQGFWRKILPDSIACRLYVLTVLIETTIDLAVEGELLIRVHQVTENQHNRMPVYLTIFAIAHIFQFVMALEAVYTRNTLQFLALTIFNGFFLLYSIVQIREIQETIQEFSASADVLGDVPIKVLTTIIPIVISVAELAYIALGWKIYNEFGWKVYKFLGADRRIKKMYANYQIYECLVKFDVFFWAGFSIQFIWLVLNKEDWEYYITCAALPLSLVLLVEGHLAARHESKLMMATFISGCAGGLVYFVYKLVKVLMYRNTATYSTVWKLLTFFSVIAILLLLVTFIYSMMVLRNFGRGLKESLARRDTQHQRTWSQSQHYRTASANPNRMSID